jgi:hypothetical protein
VKRRFSPTRNGDADGFDCFHHGQIKVAAATVFVSLSVALARVLNTLVRGTVPHIDPEMLKLLAAIGPENLQIKLVAAAEIRRRPIECDKGRRFEGEALPKFLGLEPAAFDNHGSKSGRRYQADRREWSEAAIVMNVGVNTNAKVLPGPRLKVTLRKVFLCVGHKHQKTNQYESRPNPSHFAQSSSASRLTDI